MTSPSQEFDLGRRLEALREQARAFSAADQPLSVIEVCSRLLELEPSSAYYRFMRADNLRIIGRSGEAERELLQVLPAVPDDKKDHVHLRLGQLCADGGRFADAEAHFRRALAADAGTTVPYVFLAGVLSRQDRFDEAYDILVRGLRAEGDRDEVLLNMGNVKRAMGDLELARDHFEDALRHTPGYPEAELALADLRALGLLRG